MNVEKAVLKIISESDIVSCAHALLEAAQQVRNEGNAKAFLDALNEKIAVSTAFPLRDCFFNSKGYCILDSNATSAYLQATMPKIGSPMQVIQALEVYAQELLAKFGAPAGPIITTERVAEIMEYLDKEYNFTRKIFHGNIGRFIILKNTHKEMDSAFAVMESLSGILPFFFLYANREEYKDTAPECIFFHELGHAMHFHLTGDLKVMPTEIIQLLNDICFPRLATAPLAEQREVFADVLSVGLMRGSPFEKYNNYDYLSEDEKDAFALLAKRLLA